MRREICIALSALFLVGCNGHWGAESAVKSATLGELMVAQKLPRDADYEDMERRLQALRLSQLPFNVDRTLGQGLKDCRVVSDVSIVEQQFAVDANLIKTAFKVSTDFSVEMLFLVRAMDVKVGYLYAVPLYGMRLKVSKGEHTLLEDDLYSLHGANLLMGLTNNCDDILKDLQQLEAQFQRRQAAQLAALKKRITDQVSGDWEPNPEKTKEDNMKDLADLEAACAEWNPDPTLSDNQNREALYAVLTRRRAAK